MRKRYLRHLIAISSIGGIFFFGGCQLLPEKSIPWIPKLGTNNPAPSSLVKPLEEKVEEKVEEEVYLDNNDIPKTTSSSKSPSNIVAEQPPVTQHYPVPETPKSKFSEEETGGTAKSSRRDNFLLGGTNNKKDKDESEEERGETATGSHSDNLPEKTNSGKNEDKTVTPSEPLPPSLPPVVTQQNPETPMPSTKKGEPLEIKDLRSSPLDVYDAPNGEWVKKFEDYDLDFPIEVLAISSNGRFQINLDDKAYWVDTAFVETNRKYYPCFKNQTTKIEVKKITSGRGLGECDLH